MAEVESFAEGTPCWVDVSTTDVAGTVSFYTGLFGWEAQTNPSPEAGGYTMFSLRGRFVAAAGPAPPGVPPSWTTYLASDDADATAARAREAGGTVLVEPFDVLDAGRMAILADPTGAVFGIWQARAHIGARLVDEPGSLTWNECRTGDPEAAAAFYAAVFGLERETRDMAGRPYLLLRLGDRSVAGVAELAEGEAGVPPHWNTVLAVAGLDDARARVEELGGANLTEPTEVPGVGRFSVAQDPQGATFQLLEG